MKPAILIVCGGIEAVHGIRRAKELGLHVVVSDRDPNAPGLLEADDCLISSTYDSSATMRAAQRYAQTVRPIHGVLSIGGDVPWTVANVAQSLGLPGLSLEAAHLASDKLAMKERLRARGVPVPWFEGIESAAHLARRRTEHAVLVVKPVDSRGSRGVVRLTPAVDTKWAFEQAREISPTGRVMAEAYLDGPQVSTESILVAGQLETPGFADRNYEYLERFAPYFIENGGDLPSHLPAETQRAVKRVVAQAAAALGFDHGTIKGDIVVHHGRATIIELAPRLSGGYFCTLEIPLNTGVDFVGCAIRAALGQKISPADVSPKLCRPVVQRYVFPGQGRILSLDGVEAARALPGIQHVIVSRHVGDVTHAIKDTTSRSAMVIATAVDIEEARQRAQAATELIRVVTDDENKRQALAG
jgi:biotin carboxylase